MGHHSRCLTEPRVHLDPDGTYPGTANPSRVMPQSARSHSGRTLRSDIATLPGPGASHEGNG